MGVQIWLTRKVRVLYSFPARGVRNRSAMLGSEIKKAKVERLTPKDFKGARRRVATAKCSKWPR
jgi:hypothetical protein